MGYDKDLFNKAVSLKQDAQNQANLSGFLGSFVQGFQQARAAEEQRQTSAELIGLLNASYGDDLNLPRRIAGQIPPSLLFGMLAQRREWEARNRGMDEFDDEKFGSMISNFGQELDIDPTVIETVIRSTPKTQRGITLRSYSNSVMERRAEREKALGSAFTEYQKAMEDMPPSRRQPFEEWVKTHPLYPVLASTQTRLAGGGMPSLSPGPGPAAAPSPGPAGGPGVIGGPGEPGTFHEYKSPFAPPYGPKPPPPGLMPPKLTNWQDIDRTLFQTMPGAKAEVPPDPVTPPPVKPATPASIVPVGGVGPKLEFSGMEPLAPGRSGLSDRGRALKDARRAAREGRVDEEAPLTDEEKEDLVRRLAETMKRMGM